MTTDASLADPPPPRPQRTLAGRVAIVTGAGAAGDGIGNGRAAAILLAEDHSAVVCVDRDLALAQRTVDMIQEDNPSAQAMAIQADVTAAADCEKVVAIAVSTYGRVDILFNCVGVGGPKGTAVDVDIAAWTAGLNTNVTSMVLMAKYAIPVMARNDNSRGYRGSIVNMGSVAGLQGGTPHLLYPTSKGAIVNMTRAQAAQHARDGIRVNCVCPGMVYTPMMYAGGMSEEARQARRNRSLLKTEGTAWDVGCAVRFLAGDEARWMTGVVLPVDGGTTAATAELPKGSSVSE